MDEGICLLHATSSKPYSRRTSNGRRTWPVLSLDSLPLGSLAGDPVGQINLTPLHITMKKNDTIQKAHQTLVRTELALKNVGRTLTGKQSYLPYKTAVNLERKINEIREIVAKEKRGLIE
jgi:hypothetical protein